MKPSPYEVWSTKGRGLVWFMPDDMYLGRKGHCPSHAAKQSAMLDMLRRSKRWNEREPGSLAAGAPCEYDESGECTNCHNRAERAPQWDLVEAIVPFDEYDVDWK